MIVIKILQYILKTLYGLVAIGLFYYMCCLVLPLVTINSDYLIKNTGIMVYVGGDGYHSELILPLKNEYMDWEGIINKNDFDSAGADRQWISFGFGEQDFHEQNRSWEHMNYLTAFKSLCALGKPVMYVALEQDYPFKRKFCRRVYLTRNQYQKLVAYIQNSFSQNNGTQCAPIESSGTRPSERLYESNQEFSFFKTCNTWTNNGLKAVGYKTGVWTALEGGIRDQFTLN